MATPTANPYFQFSLKTSTESGVNLEAVRKLGKGSAMLRTRSTTTSDQKLQFRGVFSTGCFGISPVFFSFFSGFLCSLVRKASPKVGENRPISGRRKKLVNRRCPTVRKNNSEISPPPNVFFHCHFHQGILGMLTVYLLALSHVLNSDSFGKTTLVLVVVNLPPPSAKHKWLLRGFLHILCTNSHKTKCLVFCRVSSERP